ncbi:kazal-type inhibitor-like protein [Heptranchias perlo]|uniref:kazal-type inhibitor-like protein n=1 Tax=Heptranchias perlo TaxID=212740 RepID=UPI00355A8824
MKVVGLLLISITVVVGYLNLIKDKAECEGYPTFYCSNWYPQETICGSNGRTYPDRCTLCLYEWISGFIIYIAHRGPC